MLQSPIEGQSIFSLVTALCRQIALQKEVDETYVSKLRKICFEILLKKSKHRVNWPDDVENYEFDALRALNAHLFAIKLDTKAKGQDCNKLEADLESKIKAINEHGDAYFAEGSGCSVLQFLLALQCNIEEDSRDVPLIRPKEFFVPGPFTLHADYSTNRYYPKSYVKRIKGDEPKYFQGLRHLQKLAEYGFVPQTMQKHRRDMLFEPNKILASHLDTKVDDEHRKVTFTSLTRRHICSDADWIRVDMRSLQFAAQSSANFYALQMRVVKCMPFPADTFLTSAKSTTHLVESASRKPKEIIPQISQEEHLCRIKPFASDANVALELQALVNQEQKIPFQARIMTTEKFLHDLKLLTVGIQSDTFCHNELFIFSMMPAITIANVLPATIANYVKEFLECGTCYKRLQFMTMRREYKLTYDGFIFKALCDAINEYLLTFRHFVFLNDSKETLVSFYKRMKKSLRLIVNLSTTLAIHPKVDLSVKIPTGSQFLGYIYREIIRLTDDEYITLLMFLLKRCCHVYFKYLQLWIFHGVLDDPAKELFICFADHYREDTKHFYDKAYFVNREAVPGFFQNYEDRILQCGKYTMLLNAYKPNHPLFELDCPKISVRLSFEEIQKLENSCIKYAERAREICGKPITVSDIFEAHAKKRRDFQQMVYQRTRENMERWNDEQQAILYNAAEKKRKRFEELTARLEDARQQKIEKRREGVEKEIKALREIERFNDVSLECQNINLRKRIEYYEELNNTLGTELLEREKTSLASSERKRRHSITSVEQTQSEETFRSATSVSTTSLDRYRGLSSDFDSISQYTECASNAFEIEFAKTAQELQAYCEQREKEYGNNNYVVTPEGNNLIQRQIPLTPQIEVEKCSIPRSISDVINSNVLNDVTSESNAQATTKLSSLQQNRLKTLTGTIELCLGRDLGKNNVVDDNRMTIMPQTMHVVFERDAPSTGMLSAPLTELQLNRKKVLSAGEALHSNLKGDSLRKSLPDINLNIIQTASHSDLERNRKRMMEGPSPFIEYNKHPFSERGLHTLTTEPLTELERNRRKILTEEYAFHSAKKEDQHHKSLPDFNLSTLPAEKLTDMQRNRRRMMESEHPFTEYNKPALSSRPKLNLALDTERARNRRRVLESEYNILTGDALSAPEMLTPMSTTSDPSHTEQLSENGQKSDVSNGDSKLNDMATLTLPSTAATQEPKTPLAALNTAGVRAKSGEGFEFPLSDSVARAHKSCNLSLINDADEVCIMPNEPNYNSPYKWCAELIESKFQCSTRSSVFRLNAGLTPNKSSSCNSTQNLKDLKIDSMSVITLTELLQKSIIIPMNTHLELVNIEVLRVLLEDLRLIEHFRSLRHYFFLMDGEFGAIIGDGIIGRVESGAAPTKILSYQTLHMILDTALSYSIQKDRNAERLSFYVSEIPSKFELNSPNVLNMLNLSYRVEWPLNLVINPETLEQYANIFKYLLKVRRISWVLENAFEILRQAGKRHGKTLLRSPQYLRVQQIRHKFYLFVNTLQHHITATALQASWKLFKDELLHAKSLEDIYRMHTKYVKRILFLCMLNRSSVEFNNTIDNIFRVSLKFYNNLKSRDFKQIDNSKEFTHSRFTKMVSEEQEFNKLLKYTIYLGNKIVRRGYQAEIGEFITLINVNQYYTTQCNIEQASKTQKYAENVSEQD